VEKSTTTRFPDLHGERHGSDVSAAQSTPHQQTRVSRAHEDEVGTRDTLAATQEGTQAPHREGADQTSEPVTRETFPRRSRLARGPEVEACWREGRRIRTTHLDLAWRPNPYARARAAVIVPRYQFTAVARNRLRRRLRELLRRGVLATFPAVDVVVRAKRLAYQAPFDTLRAELTDAAAHV
jgi:ribonuclease P protein component